MMDNKDKRFPNINGEKEVSLAVAMEQGDFKGIKEVLDKGREFAVNEVVASGIRGRGGSWFPTGEKWKPFLSDEARHRRFIVNANEGEPDTFKDHMLLLHEPYKVLEGAIYGAFACGAADIYISLNPNYEDANLEKIIGELGSKGLLFGIKFHIVRGGGMVVAGEETAVMESVAARPPKPRIKPPYPFEEGVCINNVETLANIPFILKRGADEFRSVGSAGNPGSKLYCIGGDVNSPGVYEEAIGIGLKSLVDNCAGGIKGGWDNVLAVRSGGFFSSPLLPEEAERAFMSDESLKQFGSFLGTGSITVIDKSKNILDIALGNAEFYAGQSCGKCSVCREGTNIAHQMLARWRELSEEEKTSLRALPDKMEALAICSFVDSAADNVRGFMNKFSTEIS